MTSLPSRRRSRARRTNWRWEGKSLVVKHTVPVVITPEFQERRWTAREKRLRQAILDHVMRNIAQYVARSIAGKTPRGWGSSQRHATVSRLGMAWGKSPTIFYDQEVVRIGRVADLNAASGYPLRRKGGGTWNYGVWFNVEWGREFPYQGTSWVYQENPGPNSPQNSAPPGAGPADIEMVKWVKQRNRRGGGVEMSLPGRVTKNAEFRLPKRRSDVDLKLHAEWERKNAAAGKYTRRTWGRFGTAPIRRGFAQGTVEARGQLGTWMKEALQAIGKLA